MRIRVSVPTSESTRMREKVLENAETVEVDVVKEEEWQVVSLPFNNMKFEILNSKLMQVMLIDPVQFRTLNELMEKEFKGQSRIETLTFAATTTATAES